MTQAQYIDAGGRRLRHVIVGDDGEAVVLVHGFAGSLESWEANQGALAKEGHTVAALDLPGHGESSLDVGSGSLDELAATVLAYMDAVGIGRAHLVGHSMGAAACLVVADRAPERVRSLVLAGPAGLGQKINADVIRGLIVANDREALAPLLQVLFAEPSHVTDEMLERLVAHKHRPGATEALAKIASSRYAGTPSGRQLRDVVGTVPTLMIWGVDDRMIPAPAPGDIVHPAVLIRVLPRAGHMVQLEAADAFNELVADFLRR
jgi:pyruvate dehydrogenase E2 component (dihydrolipoamide acetyltransferase)